MHRREALKLLGALSLLRAAAADGASPEAETHELRYLGEPVPFDYAALKGRAKALAAQPYQKPDTPLPEEVKQ